MGHSRSVCAAPTPAAVGVFAAGVVAPSPFSVSPEQPARTAAIAIGDRMEMALAAERKRITATWQVRRIFIAALSEARSCYPRFGSGLLLRRLCRCSNRLADHEHQHLRAYKVAICRAANIVRGYRLDLGVSLVDIVEAEFLELNIEQIGGNFDRRVETQRIGTDQIFLRLVELVGGRAV